MESQTFENILHIYGDYILRLCYTYTKDWQIAEDLTQETFIRYYNAQRNFRHDAEVKTYLYRIAINRCKSYLTSLRFKQFIFQDFASKMKAKEDVESTIERKEQAYALFKLIEMLPLKYREVIVLYHYFEMTTLEISNILKVSENTVKTRLRRGRKQLSNKLEKGDEGIG